MSPGNPDDVVALEVRIRGGSSGEVRSSHGFLAPGDEARAMRWPMGGVPQIAYGLLVEAARREAYATVLAKMSHDGKFLEGYLAGGPEKRKATEEELARIALKIMTSALEKMGSRPVEEVLAMLAPKGPQKETP